MHPDKRRAGRAIRKARREASAQLPAALATFSAIAEAAGEALIYLAGVFSEFVNAIDEAYRETTRRLAWMREQERRKEFEWRLSHRALTTGK